MIRGSVQISVFFFQVPDLADQQAVQKFFLQEVQLGEELLASGMFLLKLVEYGHLFIHVHW